MRSVASFQEVLNTWRMAVIEYQSIPLWPTFGDAVACRRGRSGDVKILGSVSLSLVVRVSRCGAAYHYEESAAVLDLNFEYLTRNVAKLLFQTMAAFDFRKML